MLKSAAAHGSDGSHDLTRAFNGPELLQSLDDLMFLRVWVLSKLRLHDEAVDVPELDLERR
ncbi:MAG TPA: hypothetical protein PKD64_01905 [Pirellulaceae bacterium]|nr:hypothetical protein [Pirellulaceae bacterium]HMO90924.1 hypothetical protein [Pirellulaceae bacterium]HMP68600.1 hypothetical protein [Pirellulaceae bacterium]